MTVTWLINQTIDTHEIIEYEQGRHTPDITALQRMADELGVPLNYFFCEDDSAAELACLIDKLSEEGKALLINQLLDNS